MDRRNFLASLGAAGAWAALGCGHRAAAGDAAAGAMATGAATGAAPAGTETRKAWAELMELLREAEARTLSPEWGIRRPADVADGHRYLLHVLHSALDQKLEADPLRPQAVRFVKPNLKLLGDNPDAIYYTAPVHPERRYRVRGNTSGAVYTSLTIEGGNADGGYPDRVAGALNDTEFDVDSEGRFEVTLGPGLEGRNRLALEPDAGTLTTRHYFENRFAAAIDPRVRVELVVEPLDETPPPPTPSDASIARGIRRAANYFRAATLDMTPRDPAQQPDWVSMVPNQFNAPRKWKAGEGGFGAVDNAYAMAPYALGPDQALVIDGRWPRARFGSVVLWNRFMQTYDYANRQVSLNRAQTVPKEDGSFRMVIAHRDPRVPNWIDAEGRPSGLVFWRFQLPEEDIVTPQAQVVPVDAVSALG